jgi:hypothetical protein
MMRRSIRNVTLSGTTFVLNAAGDESHGEVRGADAGDLRHRLRIGAADRVEVGQHAGRRFERIDPGVGTRRVRRAADDLDFEVQASVVRRRDPYENPAEIAKSGRESPCSRIHAGPMPPPTSSS